VLIWTDFEGCDLRGADFTGARFNDARFPSAKTEGAIGLDVHSASTVLRLVRLSWARVHSSGGLSSRIWTKTG
jgi:uncharacterized protein YjbI with pentapeptide repeats